MRGALIAVVLVLALGSVAADASTPALPHVTLIGDSVADAIEQDNAAIATLEQGVSVDFEVAPCRRLDGQSCPYNGSTPPTLVQLAQTMGAKLGPNVIVAVGYNDFETQYAQNIETALAALEAAGVKHVWWLTLRASRHPYLTMNADIAAAAANHPELTVIDWNLYSRSHPSWFQADGVHLLEAGSIGMATLIHQTLVNDGVALKPVKVASTQLPTAHRGRRYAARLRATAGLAPYRWSLLERAPKGLRLLASGAILGDPEVPPGRYVLGFRVTDAVGSFATRQLTLRVRL